jgi:hypothetical protein
MISWKKQNHIDQVDLQSFHEGLPQYDEDGFMAELQARPDQDELEESKKFMERGSLLHVLLGLQSPTPVGKR